MINILPTAVLDDKQKRVIYRIQQYTIASAVTLTVTRGHSSPADQLSVIERYARQHDCLFSEFVSGDVLAKVPVWRDGKEMQVYAWQQTWSALLVKGVVINPPLACLCLEHYIRPSGQDMYGLYMEPSPHITSDAIDFSARVDRGTPKDRSEIDLVSVILQNAKAGGAGIRYIKLEPNNGCVHIDLEKEA